MPRTGVEVYSERPRTYRSTLVIVAAIVAGFVVDVGTGAGGSHVLAWLAALVVIAGFDAVGVAASGRLRSIRITPELLVVGEHTIARSTIVGVVVPADRDVDPIAPAPRRSTLVGVRTAGGGTLGVPSRRPEELAGALGFRSQPELLEVRPAGPDDLAGLPELERRADTVFAVAGIGPLPPAADVATFAASAALFVAGRPAVGLARVELVDGFAHLEQVSVLPSHMRRGVGRSLLDAAVGWARDTGNEAITLCTFADVPWNGPFYARHGFEVVAAADLGPGLRALVEQERVDGLSALGRRVVMRRPLR